MGKKDRKQKIDYREQKKRKWKVQFRIPKFLIPRDEPSVPRAFTSIDYAGGIMVFFICWAVYLHTLTPTIGFHDSGDMVTAAFVLGIPHPTGYPLYCLLGKLWMTILPIGNIAYRMNLASALCASLACMIVYFITLKVVSGKWRMASEKENNLTSRISFLVPAAIASLMLAFATTFWEQAVIAEKYTLNALFATLLIFILLKWQEAVIEYKNPKSKIRNPKSYLYLFAFILGLSFTHHLQTIYLVPASIFFIIAVYWKKWRQEKQSFYSLLSTLYSLLLKMFCLFILPLFLYLYLPIRASQHPPIQWGDFSTLRGFITHVIGKEYEYYHSSSTNEALRYLYTHITHFFVEQFTIYLLWIGLIGAILLIKKRMFFIFLSLIILTNIFYSIHYNVPNIKDYYIPSYFIFSMWISYGILKITEKFITHSHSQFLKIGITIIFLVLPFISFIEHYSSSDKKRYYYAYDYGVNMLMPLEEKAFFLVKYDRDAFISWYLHYIEKQKPNLYLIDITFLHYEWYIRKIKETNSGLTINFSPLDKKFLYLHKLANIRFNRCNELISYNFRNHSLYIAYDKNIASNYSLVPKGILCKIFEKKVNIEEELINIKFNYRGKFSKTAIIDKDALDTIKSYAEVYNYLGAICINSNMYKRAIDEFENALKIYPDFEEVNSNLSEAHYNLGVVYDKEGDFNKSIREYQMAIKINPNHSNAYWGLGFVLQKIEKYNEAIKNYKKAIKIEPDNINFRTSLGITYVSINMYKKAIAEFQKVVSLTPSNIDVHMNLAIAYYKEGLLEKVLSECKYILNVDPNNTYARQMLEEIKNKGKGGK
ncbi:MAG: DUF2723 domain-containing protein [bacterium]